MYSATKKGMTLTAEDYASTIDAVTSSQSIGALQCHSSGRCCICQEHWLLADMAKMEQYVSSEVEVLTSSAVLFTDRKEVWHPDLTSSDMIVLCTVVLGYVVLSLLSILLV